MGRVLVVAMAAAFLVGGSSSEDVGSARDGALKDRGRYLVERVGMCQDCHTQRDENGAFVEERWLGGAPIGFAPSSPMPWSEMAPPIAGLPTMDHDQAVRFLMSGEKPDGSRSRPPMPEYRLEREDAEAVVVYLESLVAED